MAHNSANLVGQKFNRLLVISLDSIKEEAPSPKRGDYASKRRYWKCLCDCGNETIVTTKSLRSGNTKSCGCINTERITKHNKYKSREYSIWIGIKSRCNNPKSASYKWYGGRGISICKRWDNSFTNFFKDMGKAPSSKHIIDRINNDGNYEPSNCRWTIWYFQNRNHRRNVFFEFNGKKMCQEDWAKEIGIHPRTLCDRIQRGWSVEDALTKPVQSKTHS